MRDGLVRRLMPVHLARCAVLLEAGPMTMQAKSIVRYLRRSLTADPGRFAGASAVIDPLGLLAVEGERLTEPTDAGLSGRLENPADIPCGGPAAH